ncbi:hypothetical protein BDV29DRAFT_180644 [Aspergillus leporis]|jgi:hypothetical protein|uniref:Uncharacterized protein n=1 Tax=Aspergillus leporis TaxID=41062 RepID=A0A5N5WTZ9_9EURO|nr:hypothetical protein BDV29DRAFT_180644 [Aspergillus leporis]
MGRVKIGNPYLSLWRFVSCACNFQRDEIQPTCQRCRVYGVLGNYGYDAPDLQMVREIEDPAVISVDATTTLEIIGGCRNQLALSEQSQTVLTIATVHHKEVLLLEYTISTNDRETR